MKQRHPYVWWKCDYYLTIFDLFWVIRLTQWPIQKSQNCREFHWRESVSCFQEKHLEKKFDCLAWREGFLGFYFVVFDLLIKDRADCHLPSVNITKIALSVMKIVKKCQSKKSRERNQEQWLNFKLMNVWENVAKIPHFLLLSSSLFHHQAKNPINFTSFEFMHCRWILFLQIGDINCTIGFIHRNIPHPHTVGQG